MKITINAKTFATALAKLSRVIASKNVMAILDNFLLEAYDNKLFVTASDIENRAIMQVDIVELDGDGSICINAKRLGELMKSIGDQPVAIAVDGTNVTVKTANGEYNLTGYNSSEYPKIEDREPSDNLLLFEPEVLTGSLNKVRWAVGNDDLRPQMKGVLMDVKPQTVTFAATDTRKLCRYVIGKQCGLECKAIIATKTVSLLLSMFGDTEGIGVGISDNNIVFTTDGVTLISQLVKGNFPDYNRVIPNESKFQLTVDRKSLIASIGRVSAFAEGVNGLVKLHADNFTATLGIESTDLSYALKGKESMSCDFNGDKFLIGFSAEYLLQLLSTLTGEQAVFNLNDTSRPAKFVESSESGEYTAILIPMTVQDV